jgi:hypothetical protein
MRSTSPETGSKGSDVHERVEAEKIDLAPQQRVEPRLGDAETRSAGIPC